MAQHAQKHQTQEEVVQRLLHDYGKQTFAAEAKIHLKNTPAPLFQLLILALMLSARIASDKAIAASASLFSHGLTTPEKMADATWQQRVDAITWSGYKRYDERTATMLGDTAQRVLDEYQGDLRNLHEQTGDDAQALHKHLQKFKGIGAVGANIFMREVQAVWKGIYPFADPVVLRVAKNLGLPDSPKDLSHLCAPKDFSRLTAALMRVKLGHEEKHVLEEVGS